ncbi:MAG: hypothetical protein V4719_10775 [Planctomycetota bacterium]
MAQFYPFRSRRKYSQSEGVNFERTWWVKCEALGKSRDPDEAPYLMANEWISGSIAQFLRLPIPAFALLCKKTKSTAMFCSYSYEGDTSPEDVDPDILYAKYPQLCTGITVFDMLVVNCDRHGGNIKVDDPIRPELVHVFDHSHALFNVYPKEGIQRLKSREDRLGIANGPESRDEFHCLFELLDSLEHMRYWVKRIADIPDWFIDDICSDARHCGVTPTECAAVAAFLKERKRKLPNLIVNNKNRFPQIDKTKWELFL